jgi:hypothetical protein
VSPFDGKRAEGHQVAFQDWECSKGLHGRLKKKRRQPNASPQIPLQGLMFLILRFGERGVDNKLVYPPNAFRETAIAFEIRSTFQQSHHRSMPPLNHGSGATRSSRRL